MIVQECFPRTDTYDTDIADEYCDGTDDYGDANDRWYIVKCSHDTVDTGIVNGRARFAVRSTSSDLRFADDLPF